MNQTATLKDNSQLDALGVMTLEEQVEVLAGKGLTMKQIASCLGFGRTKLYRLKDNKKDIRDALKRGRAKGLTLVANALYTSALEGNVTAQIFYLKNRSPNEWRDRREVAVNSDTRSYVINASPRLTDLEWQEQHNLIESDS